MTTTPDSASLREYAIRAARGELAIRNLENFVRGAWPIVEPGAPLDWNWHLSLICRQLERVAPLGEINELVICIPPGHMKSLLVSVFWPAWLWLHRPHERYLCISNDDALCSRDSLRMRQIVKHPWYVGLVETAADRAGYAPWELSKDQNEKVHFINDRNGFRQCLSIGSKISGKRADGLVVDDPYDAKESVLGNAEQVARRMKEVVYIFDKVLSSRLNDKRNGYRVLIMQRLHELDLAGQLIKRGWPSVVLPTLYEPEHPDAHPDDPRTEEGELLFPARFPADVVETIKTDELGAREFGAQHQQRPSPAEGGTFQRSWFNQRTRTLPAADSALQWAISVDCAFKGSADSDYVVMQVWARHGARYYLRDQVRRRMNYPDTRIALQNLARRYPHATMKLIEAKANGQALIDDLQSLIPGLIPYDPKASKEARAQMAARVFEAGNVHLPTSDIAPWVDDYVEEFCAFPAGSNDDQVDASVQLLLKWAMDMPVAKWRRL